MWGEMWLPIKDLARLALSNCRLHALQIDRAVMAAVDIIREAVGMIVGLPATIDQIAKLVPAPHREIDSGAPDPVSSLNKGTARSFQSLKVPET